MDQAGEREMREDKTKPTTIYANQVWSFKAKTQAVSK